MYFRYFANSLLVIYIAVCTANPIYRPDRSITLSTDITVIDHLKISPTDLPDSIRPRHTLSKRAAPWTSLGNGWMATVVNFTPIVISAAARTALRELYTGVGSHCMAGMLQGSTTPDTSLVLRIGELQFIAESTSVMEWEVIFQFVLKMREMLGHGAESMYTAMFANVAGHAMLFSIRVPGFDGEPIPAN